MGKKMGRPKKILSDVTRDTISMDLDFSKTMLHTTKLTVKDLTVVLRHLDMVRHDLAQLIINSQQNSKKMEK